MLRPKPKWLEPMFPWEQKSVTVNGRNMAYIDEGPSGGRPILLLSGNPTWGFLYRDFIAPLTAASYRAIAPDWVGAGYSDHPRVDAALTLAHHIADLVSLIDQLDLRGYVIVGQDWGGPQGLGAALARIDRLGALVLMNTWVFTDYVGWFHAAAKPWTTWHAPVIGAFMCRRIGVISHGGPPATSMRGITVPEIMGYHHVYAEADSDHVTLTWPRSIPMREGDRGWQDMHAIEQRLPELDSTPVLLLWGVDDMVFNVEYAHRLKQLLPHAEGPILLENASHFLQDDRGADIARQIAAFLDRSAGATI